jgi:serine/threonine-protein kinase
VERDGGALGPAAWGSSLPIDPGEHTVVVSAPGMTPWKTKFTAVEAATQTLTVPPLVPLPASPAPEPSAAPSDSASRSPLRWIGLGVGGAGLLTLGVSGYFALHASNLNSESKEDGHCTPDNACDAVGGEKRDDAKSAANIATGTLIAGGVLTAAGAVMFIVGSSRKHEATSARVEAVPLIGPRQLAFAVRGRF